MKKEITIGSLWEEYKGALFVVVLAVLIAIALHRCNNSTPSVSKQKVITKEQKGSFQGKPESTPIINNYFPTKGNENIKAINDLIQSLIEENKNLSLSYSNANDSLKKALFEKAIQLNAFNKTFEDKEVKIDISGTSRGTVEDINAKWTIKPQEIEVEVKQKQRVFSLKAGGEYGNTLELNKSVFKGNLEFENKKGNSYNVGYDTDKRIWVGAKFTIFNINK